MNNAIIAEIICLCAGIAIDRILCSIDFEENNTSQANLLKFYESICGERSQQYLTYAIENDFAKYLGFDNASILYMDEGRLFAINYIKNYEGKLRINTFVPLPSTFGLTGKCISSKEIVLSKTGMNDILYDSQIDNALRIKEVNSIMVLPLLVEHVHDEMDSENENGFCELVGVLQLMNYKEGDITKANFVNLM